MKAIVTYEDGTADVLTEKATRQTLAVLGNMLHMAKELATDALKCANEHQRERIKKIVEHL